MAIRDIVNRDIVNLTNCDQEPIHIPGSIQPHGFLLALSDDDTIDFCSGNTKEYIGVRHEELLGQKAADVGIVISKALPETATEWQQQIRSNTYRISAHRSGSHTIIECEPENPHAAGEDAYAQTIRFLSFLNAPKSLKELCEMVARSTRRITGYDRVMVYRFDADYNGEVFAEDVREDLEPFLGLHYPHTDIPAQARELYMRNHLRIITDINYTPVPIYTHDMTGQTLDLSLSTLRSTSPIHVKYLSNMGVGATLTISLIHHGRLWGLIACHHYSPKNISPDVRAAAHLQGQFITSQIDIRQSNEEYEVARQSNIALEKLSALALPAVGESLKIVSMSPYLLKVCNASGVSIVIGDSVYSNGISPREDDVFALANRMAALTNEGQLFTEQIINFVPDMKRLCKVVSGVIYHSLGNGNAILWYRPEHITEVHWGGDPNKAIVRDENGLHPRNSFNKWKEVVKCKSLPWLQPEINAAANWGYTLQKQISMMRISTEEEKYRKLSEVLRETNAELENINWISTHDLQEPLRKIQLQASRLMTREGEILSESALSALKSMTQSANRMQTLLSDILKYTRIRNTQASFEMVDLTGIVDEIIREMSESLQEHNAVIERDNLATINGIPFLLKQLFSNLLQNSLKYMSESRPLLVSITTLAYDATVGQNRFVKIEITDNGIGFDPKHAEIIFNIFTRLHTTDNYKGSGVGLALCKKIMQTHEGYISAVSTPNQGTTIVLHFPAT